MSDSRSLDPRVKPCAGMPTLSEKMGLFRKGSNEVIVHTGSHRDVTLRLVVSVVSREHRLHLSLLYAAYGWLLFSGILQFVIDAFSHHSREKRITGSTTSLHYGLNTTYALGQILFAVLALFAIRQGVTAMGQWSGLVLGFSAAGAWLVICLPFLEAKKPRVTLALFAVLLLGAALTS